MSRKLAIKALVARMDGTGKSGFALGSIQPQKDVPVLLDFNQMEPRCVVGSAELTVEGENVYATIPWTPELEGRYPALGFTSAEHHASVGFVVVDKCDVLAVGACVGPNQDPTIPPIKSPD